MANKKVVQNSKNLKPTGRNTGAQNKNGKPNNKPVKKKRHGCRNCLITLLVIFVLINAGIYIAGDYFAKKYLDMSLWDCFGVVYDITHSDGKKIVTNGYSDNDYKQFDSELKKQLFLKDGVDFNTEKLIKSFLDEYDNNGSGGELLTSEGSVNAKTSEVLNAGFNKDALIDELSALYVRENLDMERLRAYSDEKHDQYVMKVSDKMLAAVINKGAGIALKSTDKLDGIKSTLKTDDIASLIKIDQLTFGEATGKINGSSQKVKTVKVTVSADVRSVADSYLKELTGKNLGFAVNLILPKRFYVTAVLPVTDGASLDNYVYLNNTNDKKMNRMFKLAQSVTKLVGSELDAKAKIQDVVDDTIGSAVGKVNEYVPLDSADGHVIKLDPFETLVEYSGINKDSDGNIKPESERITSGDFINALSGVLSADGNNTLEANKAYDFKHWYRDNDRNTVVYVKTLPQEGNYTMVDYRQAFFNEIVSKYMLDKTRGNEDPSDDLTFDELMDIFGIKASGTDSGKSVKQRVLELIDVNSHIDDILATPAADRKVNINSRMLGAILDYKLNDIIAEGNTLSEYNPELAYVYTYTETGHSYLVVAISVDIGNVVSSANERYSGIVTGLTGDVAVITFTIDITPSKNESFYAKSEVQYDDLSAERTEHILTIISRFASSFNVNELLEKIEEPVRTAINAMNDTMGVTICSSSINGEATFTNLRTAAQMEDVFGMIKQNVFKNDDSITADGVEKVIRGVRASADADAFETTLGIEDSYKPVSYTASLQDICDKYFINGTHTTLQGLTDYVKGNSLTNSFDFDRMFVDDREAQNMKPSFKDSDLAALIIERMGVNDDRYLNFNNIIGVHVSQNKSITVYLKVEAGSVINDTNQLKLMPAQYIYVTATVDTSAVIENNRYRTTLKINDMTGSTADTAVAMIKSLSQNSSFDLNGKADNVGKLVYDQFKEIKDALKYEPTFADGKIFFPSIYEQIRCEILGANDTTDPELIREALQGIKLKDIAEYSEYNYIEDIFKVNEILTGNLSFTAAFTATVQMNDKTFGAAIANGFRVYYGSEYRDVSGVLNPGDNFTLKQLNILASPQAIAERADIIGLMGINTVNNLGKYVEFTFKMNLENFASGNAIAHKLDDVYFTLVLEKQSDGFVSCGYHINTMSAAAQSVLMRLANVSDSDINGKISECLNALNVRYEGIEAEDLFCGTADVTPPSNPASKTPNEPPFGKASFDLITVIEA